MAQEKSLWNMKDERPDKEIYMPNQVELAELSSMVSQYTVAELEKMIAPYCEYIKKHHLYAVNTQGVKYYIPAIEKITAGKNRFKKDLTDFYAIMRAPQNTHLLLDIMSDKEQKLMKYVLLHRAASNEDATRILGHSAMDMDSTYYWRAQEVLKAKLRPFFTSLRGKGKSLKEESRFTMTTTRTYVTTYRSTFCELMELFFPEMFNVEPMPQLPEKEAASLKVYSAEQNIFANIPILSSLSETGQIEFGKTKITASVQKKIAKFLQVDEFFATGDKTIDELAVNFLGNAFCLYASRHNTAQEKPEVLIKNILLGNNRKAEYLTPVLLPHISGFRRNLLDCSRIPNLFNDILTALITLDGNGWIRTDQLICKASTLDSSSSLHFLLMYQDDFDKMSLFNNFNHEDVYINRIASDISFPLVRAYLFMMAVLGLAEVAYSPVTHQADKEATSCFDGLKYVRLTDLGRYALGRTTTYKRKEAPRKAYFELADNDLIVRTLADGNNPYESILDGMADHISKHMYKVTNESFLHQCNDKKDIENNISLFKEYVCAELPPIWADFFDQLSRKCKLLTKPKKKYQLLRLPPADKELQRIVLGDPTVKQYTLKAEDYHILVEQENFKKVCEAMKKYGYLI